MPVLKSQHSLEHVFKLHRRCVYVWRGLLRTLILVAVAVKRGWVSWQDFMVLQSTHVTSIDRSSCIVGNAFLSDCCTCFFDSQMSLRVMCSSTSTPCLGPEFRRGTSAVLAPGYHSIYHLRNWSQHAVSITAWSARQEDTEALKDQIFWSCCVVRFHGQGFFYLRIFLFVSGNHPGAVFYSVEHGARPIRRETYRVRLDASGIILRHHAKESKLQLCRI